jgi:hypothetical protein
MHVVTDLNTTGLIKLSSLFYTKIYLLKNTQRIKFSLLIKFP